MGRESRAIVTLACVFIAAFAVCSARGTFAQTKPPSTSAGWQLPPEADTLKNPLTVDEKLLASGKAIFKDKCERCHGASGRGDGPDADPDADNNDLTNPKRAERNPEGVMFYKVMNGRRKPKMPVFKEELSADQAWAVVAYAQSLRKK
jgi:mono/diheme cytochrome c family protein